MFYVYLMRAGDKHYKVGVTKDLIKRVKAIQTSNPNRIELVTSRLVEMPYAIEKELHDKLVTLAAGGGTEWFTLQPPQALELCIFIQKYPHIELSERVIVKTLLDRQLMWKKTVEKKLDTILNNYQKAVVRTIETRTRSAPVPVDVPEPVSDSMPQRDQLDQDIDRALAIFRAEDKASTSLLQRRLSIGYGRAARIMDELESRDFISAADGNRPRQLKEML